MTAAGVARMWLSVVVATAACSPIFVNKPPRRPIPPGYPLTCTKSRAAPWVDTAIGGFSLIGTVAVAAEPCDKADFGCIGKLSLLLFVPLAVGYGISAIWGHSTVGDCQDALAEKSAPPPPPVAVAPPPASAGAIWRPAIVGSVAAQVRSAPSKAAPVVATFPPGASLSVSSDMRNGWRTVALTGRIGYVEDAQLSVQ